jgi:hypothetical protein
MIVDASGRNIRLGNQLRFKPSDPILNQYAIDSWFEDYDRSVLAKRNEWRDHISVYFLSVTNPGLRA